MRRRRMDTRRSYASIRHWALRRVVSNDTSIVKGVGLLCWSIGASRGAPQVRLPAQVQRSPPEALSVTRPQALAFDCHRPLQVEFGKIVEAVTASSLGQILTTSVRRLISPLSRSIAFVTGMRIVVLVFLP